MSGRKRIYVDEGEWQRLQRQAAGLAQVRRDIPRLIQDVRRQTERDLERSLGEFDRRQAATDLKLQAMSEQARRFESETNRRLHETSQRMRRDLQATARQLRTETREQLEQHAKQVQQDLAEERRERSAAVNRLQAEIERVQAGLEDAGEVAARWLADARRLVEHVSELPHERYGPGQLAALERRLVTAEQEYAAGRGSFVMSSAQQIFHDVSDLRYAVERQDLQWRQLRADTEEALVVITGLIGQNERIAFDGLNAPEQANLDVDFWSRGALSRLEHDVREKLADVRDDERPMSAGQLRQVIGQAAPECHGRLSAVVGQATTALFASQIRANLADLIVEVLQEDHFYEHESSAYAGGDERNGFYARSAHGGGSVVVQVEPTGEGPECQVRILTYDEDTDAAETRAARSESIRRSLQQHGLAVAAVEEESGEPDPRLRDLEVIRRGDVLPAPGDTVPAPVVDLHRTQQAGQFRRTRA